MSRSMTAGIDYTSRDYDSIREAMIAKLKEKIPEFVLLIRLNWSFAIILELKDIVYLKA